MLCFVMRLFTISLFGRSRSSVCCISHLILVFTVVSSLVASVRGQCFGGTTTFERTLGHTLTQSRKSGKAISSDDERRELVRNSDSPTLRDCIGFCRQSSSCSVFVLDYGVGNCVSYETAADLVPSAVSPTSSVNGAVSAVFQEVCLRGVSDQFGAMCGDQRLWTFDRIPHSYLEGFDTRQLTSVSSRVECSRACLLESRFVCRSAEYSLSQRLCRLSAEDRRTQPAAFRRDSSNSFDYLENQCARELPDCRYDTPVLSAEAMVLTADLLEFAGSSATCAAACTNERRLSCRSYSFDPSENRCYLSSDDTIVVKRGGSGGDGMVSSRRVCTLNTCDGGLLTYEKVAGHVLRGASEESLLIPSSANGNRLNGGESMAVTSPCRAECDGGGTDCPAFVVDYLSRRCYRLDRNTQGRSHDLQERQAFSYFEKICLKGSAAERACGDRLWAFERVPGRAMRSGSEYRVLRQIPNRRDCQQACVADGCRSATYDADRLECRMNQQDRRLSPSSYVAADRSVVYLENQCILPDSSDTNCRFIRLVDRFPRYVDLSVTGVNSRSQCQRVCQSHADFICRSFSFYSTNGQCLISSEDSVSAGSETAAYLSRAGTDVYERTCISSSSISGVDSQTSFAEPNFLPTHVNGRDHGEFSPSPTNGRCHQFEMLVGVELRGIPLRPLVSVVAGSDSLLADCAGACNKDERCRVFSVDHGRQRCWQYEVEEDWILRHDHLVPTAAVSLFHRVCASCVRTNSRHLIFVSEMHSQATLSVRPDKQLSDISVDDCRQACLSERSFVCLSATYEMRQRHCHLSRDNKQTLSRSFRRSVSGSDYIENHCGASSLSQCRYVNLLSGQLILYTARSLRLQSEAECQRACDTESVFVCASYTFLTTSRHSEASCLLSAVRLSDLAIGSSAEGHTELTPGALYAERVCTGSHKSPDVIPFNGQQPVLTSTHHSVFTESSFTERPPRLHDADTLRPASPDINICPVTPTYEKVVDVEFEGARTFDIDVSRFTTLDGSSSGLLVPCLLRCERDPGCLAVSLYHNGRRDICVGLTNSAGQLGATLSSRSGATYYEKVCLEERTCGKGWTFERVPNFELEGHDDLILQRVPSRHHCQLLCLRNVQLPCRSADYNYREMTCSLSSHTRRTAGVGALVSSNSVDHLENQCADEPDNCQYRQVQGRYLPHVDRVLTRVGDQSACRSRCDIERDFRCRSYNFIERRSECLLSGDDTVSRGGESALVSDVDSVYAERSVCRMVRVDCTKTDMVVTFTFGRAFNGRVYATGNSQACFDTGNGRRSLVMPIPLGRRCGTEEVSRGRFINNVVIQQHPTIMQQTDKTVRVVCTFDADDQTITLAPTGNRFTEGGGVRVSPGNRQNGPSVSSVVTNTAPTPSVGLRVIAASDNKNPGRDSSADVDQVALGELLTLVVVADAASAFGVFAKGVEARTDNGELLALIDERGCPLDLSIFPALRVEPETGNLVSTFRAFRFPSTARVNFFATVQFCQDECPPVDCGAEGRSFGRRRRRRSNRDSGNSLMNVFDENFPENVTEKASNISESYLETPPGHTERVIEQSSTLSDNLLPHELPVSTSVFVSGSIAAQSSDEPPVNDTIPYDSSKSQSEMHPSPALSNSGWDVITSWRKSGFDGSSGCRCQICTTRSAVVAAVVCVCLLQLLFLAFAVAFYRIRLRGWQLRCPSPHEHHGSSESVDPLYCSAENLFIKSNVKRLSTAHNSPCSERFGTQAPLPLPRTSSN